MKSDLFPIYTHGSRRPPRIVAPLLAFLFSTLASPLWGQSPSATGIVEGRVQNVVTGQYLNNARITVEGTDLLTLTDPYGSYRLIRVPGGRVTIEVFYTGLDPQRIELEVAPGQTLTRDVALTNARLLAETDATVRLDPFTVASSKEMDADTLAINEQRFAPNIKTVVSTEAHGQVMGGNLGEFMKFVPGVMEDVGGFEPEGILVRGFPSNMTVMTSDGAPLANGGANRSFTLEQISMNNISRVEVTKVPTPSTTADSMAGSVNMISKSAFERARPEFRYNLHLTGNANALTFKKEPDALERRTLRERPGFNFDYTLPIDKKVGLVLAGLHYQQFVFTNFSNSTFNSGGTATRASLAAPYLQTHQVQNTPQYRVRNSGSLRVDWRVTPRSVLSVGGQTSHYKQQSPNYNFSATAGTNGTPSVAGGAPFDFGPDYTIGATGRGSVGQTAGFNTRYVHLQRNRRRSVGAGLGRADLR